VAGGGDYPDWTAPQAHADAIANTGAPALTLPGQLANDSIPLNAGSVLSRGAWIFSQPTYEVSVNAFESGAGAAGPLQAVVTWFDPLGTTVLATETWYWWPGTGSNGHLVTGKGPVKGAQMFIQYQNFSAAMQYTINTKVYQRSHNYTRDDWRSVQYFNTASGNTLPVMDVTSGALAFRNVNVAAGGNDFTELPLYSGPVQLAGNTASGAADLTVTVTNSTNPNAEGVGGAFYLIQSDANGRFAAQLALPRYQCRIQLHNANAAAKVCNYWLHSVE